TLKILDVVKVHQADKAMAIASSLIFLGQFISPVILDSIGSLIGMPTIRFQHGLLGSISLIFILINFITISKNKSESNAYLINVNYFYHFRYDYSNYTFHMVL